MCKHIFYMEIYVRSKFSSVRSSHDLCAGAHVHSLEGTFMSSPLPCSRVIPLTMYGH